VAHTCAPQPTWGVLQWARAQASRGCGARPARAKLPWPRRVAARQPPSAHTFPRPSRRPPPLTPTTPTPQEPTKAELLAFESGASPAPPRAAFVIAHAPPKHHAIEAVVALPGGGVTSWTEIEGSVPLASPDDCADAEAIAREDPEVQRLLKERYGLEDTALVQFDPCGCRLTRPRLTARGVGPRAAFDIGACACARCGSRRPRGGWGAPPRGARSPAPTPLARALSPGSPPPTVYRPSSPPGSVHDSPKDLKGCRLIQTFVYLKSRRGPLGPRRQRRRPAPPRPARPGHRTACAPRRAPSAGPLHLNPAPFSLACRPRTTPRARSENDNAYAHPLDLLPLVDLNTGKARAPARPQPRRARRPPPPPSARRRARHPAARGAAPGAPAPLPRAPDGPAPRRRPRCAPRAPGPLAGLRH
jgi:hypothetical protein